MTQSIDQRLAYHPFPDAQRRHRALRRVKRRFEAISHCIDISDKTVLDLGCSGGYFSFQAAKKARSVLAVDGDKEIIKNNQIISEKYGFNNLNFQHAEITRKFINSLPQFDVTLFLSVFHHMLTASSAYDWNLGNNKEIAFNTLSAIRANTKTLVFEMGYPDEGYEWCNRMPKMGPSYKEWIIKNIFELDFERIQVINSPSYKGFGGYIRSLLARQYKGNSIVTRIRRRVFFVRQSGWA